MIGAIIHALPFFACATLILCAGDASAAERCADGGCHTGAEKLPAHAVLLRKHEQLGCTACHGGSAQATAKEAAHATVGPELLLARSNTAAGCVRCHVPGEVRGTEAVVEGSRVYLELGCHLCHRALGQGSPTAFGPPLDGIGSRGVAHLERVVRRAADVFRKTVMPEYATVLAAQPEKKAALFAYLLSLRGAARPSTRQRSDALCARCHRGKSASAGGGPSTHHCRWIQAEREVVRCRRCHKDQAEMNPEKECLYIAQRKPDCGVCHALGPGGGNR